MTDYINGETTKAMLENSHSKYWVHKGTFDRVSTILKKGKLERGLFVSFSDGLPIIPVHGDSAIIFKKGILVEKGHQFLKVEYSPIFFNLPPIVVLANFAFALPEQHRRPKPPKCCTTKSCSCRPKLAMAIFISSVPIKTFEKGS